MIDPLFLAGVTFIAIFTQSVAGFGTALIAMPLLIEAMGVQEAASMFALVAITAEIILLIRYRHAMNFQAVRRLSLASIVGVPLGVVLAQRVEQGTALTLLGVLLIGYALYALLRLRLPEIKHPNWAYGFGFLGGLLAGAYNTGGPPIVIYGTCRGWKPDEFRSNLQGYFTLNSLMVIASHALARHYKPEVVQSYLYAAPGVVLGLVVGVSLNRYINPVFFRKLVLALLIFLGLNLIF